MESSESCAPEARAKEREPWQLRMFQRSLKKQQKLAALLSVIGDVSGQQCLLITCGDNNGALNWYFRKSGGEWRWGDVMGENLNEIAELLGEPVVQVSQESFPFPTSHFDCAVAIDVLEHLDEDQPFLGELSRVLRPGGRAIVTVPNGDPRLLATRLKRLLGMTTDVYGHTRAGYSPSQLRDSVRRAGFLLARQSGYSRFFTEIVELTVNFGYVFILSRKSTGFKSGHIAPTSAADLQSHGVSYRLYSLTFPVLRILAKLDHLLPANPGYAVVIEAVKPLPAREAAL